MPKQLSGEELKIRRWLRALGIAKTLFEEDGYFTDYLEEIEAFIKDTNKTITRPKTPGTLTDSGN